VRLFGGRGSSRERRKRYYTYPLQKKRIGFSCSAPGKKEKAYPGLSASRGERKRGGEGAYYFVHLGFSKEERNREALLCLC